MISYAQLLDAGVTRSASSSGSSPRPLPRPEINARLAGYEVDFLWRTQRLVVEVDGFRFHGHRLAFERDREMQQALTAAGYRVSRITWRQLDGPHTASSPR